MGVESVMNILQRKWLMETRLVFGLYFMMMGPCLTVLFLVRKILEKNNNHYNDSWHIDIISRAGTFHIHFFN